MKKAKVLQPVFPGGPLGHVHSLDRHYQGGESSSPCTDERPFVFQSHGSTYMRQNYPGGNFPSSSDVDSEGRTYLDKDGHYIKADGTDTGVIHIRSSLPQSAGTSTMSVSATIVIASNNGVPNAQFYPTGTVVFSVEIVNPCLPGSGVSISPLVFTPANPTVMDGNTVYAQWYRPTTSVDVTHDSSGGWCGLV